MKKLSKILALVILFVCFQSYKSQAVQRYVELEWKNGSNAAQKIMVSDFYYDPLDNWSPFGNDTGSDTFYLYCDWKREHPKDNIRGFVNEELIDLGYPNFDLSITGADTERLKRITSTMLNQYVDLNAINNKMISLAFAQLFLEGRIEPEVKNWAEAAFSREAAFLDFWEEDQSARKVRMEQLLNDMRKAN